MSLSLVKKLSLALVLSSCYVNFAFSAEMSTEEVDARALLGGKSANGILAQSQITMVEKELKAIRLAISSISQIHDASFGSRSFQSMTVEFDKETQKNLVELAKTQFKLDPTQQEVQLEFDIATKPMFTPEPILNLQAKLSQLPVGYHMILRLTGGVMVLNDGTLRKNRDGSVFQSPLYLEGPYIEFNSPIDADGLGRTLKLIPHVVYAGAGGVSFDGDRIFRIEKKVGEVLYVFRKGSGDCMAGCINVEYTYVRLNKSSNKVSEVKPSTPNQSLWGFPRRFSLQEFSSYNDLLLKLRSKNWWERLHAVAATNMILANGHSGFGEDDAPKSLALVEEIKTHRQQLSQLLEALKTTETDSDVRAALETGGDYALTVSPLR